MRHQVLVLGFLALGCSLNANGETGIIDDNRLLKAQADSSNWLSHGRDYSNQRFSPLKQITRATSRALPLPGRSTAVCRPPSRPRPSLPTA